MTAKQFKT